uniref:Secretory carrier-associated membrane protein n=1 Tax=Ciona intestinalis TaxID=7719 RepID=F6S3S9_CIOIN|nr:secretory carrier-associated membrane protein 1-like [Ciona intestinalis]|eukprot:XP_002127112.1 secretory carrier-associated membrane protein 1-like [Ciona intestinalis]
MSNFDANPFADPFQDGSVTAATSSDKANLEDFNPFAQTANDNNAPAMMQPTNPPPPYTDYGSNNISPNSAPPVAAPAAPPVIPGHEELLKRQEELERKAEELQRREQQMASSNYNPRSNNWPPIPKWFPVGPCFYQDFSVDIPHEFQTTIKMLYYLWMFYCLVMFFNMLTSLAVFCVDSTTGTGFGLSILWWLLFTPCSLCWYRPAYKAFRSDSSFNFFLFFFIMFFQACVGVIMAVGIPNSGYSGWIVALGHFDASKGGPGIGIMASIQSTMFTVMAVLSIILLKKVHSVYRSTGASFEKAQQEFASDVMKNPGVQTAAANAAGAAASSAAQNLGGRY